jgi:hypothetical protein
MGFAGNMWTAADYLRTLGALQQALGEGDYDRRFSIQELVLTFTTQLGRFADAVRFPDGTLPSVDFVFSGRARPNVPIFQSLHVSLPAGTIQLLTQEGITVLGKGREFFKPIGDALAGNLDNWRKLAAHERDPLHWLAWRIQTHICGLIAHWRGRPASVGAIMHAMYVDQTRVTALECILGPPADAPGVPVRSAFGGGYQVTYRGNRFRLRVGADGSETVLLTPPEIIAQGQGLDARQFEP